MKNSAKYSIAVLFLIFMYSSCSLFDKVDDVTFETEFPVNFSISESEVNPSGKAYSSEVLLDIASDPDVSKYASKIKEVKITKITYLVQGVSDPTVNFDGGTMRMVSTNKVIASLGSTLLTEMVTGSFNSDSDGFSELSARLKSNKQEIIRLSGILSKTPISCNLQCVFYVTVTADALK
jgi:hypothetical protein